MGREHWGSASMLQFTVEKNTLKCRASLRIDRISVPETVTVIKRSQNFYSHESPKVLDLSEVLKKGVFHAPGDSLLSKPLQPFSCCVYLNTLRWNVKALNLTHRFKAAIELHMLYELTFGFFCFLLLFHIQIEEKVHCAGEASALKYFWSHKSLQMFASVW